MFFGQGGGGFGPFGGGGGGGFGGPFGGGSTFQFYGPGGVRMGTNMPRQGPGAQGRAGTQQSGSIWLQMAPLLFLFALSLLTQLPSLFSSADSIDPDFSFDRSSTYSVPRTTTTGVQYFVSPDQFAQHPMYESILTANPSLGFTSQHPPKSARYRRDLVDHLKQSAATASPVNDGSAANPEPSLKIPSRVRSFEKNVESAWVNRLHAYCRHEVSRRVLRQMSSLDSPIDEFASFHPPQITARNDRLDAARGFLGIGRDPERMSQILAEKVRNTVLDSLSHANVTS